MENKGIMRSVCLALIHTALAFAIWFLLRKGLFQDSDGGLSVLFLSIGVFVALGMDTLAFLLLFLKTRDAGDGGRSGVAIIFLLIHSLLLAGLWWLEATGKLLAGGSVDALRLGLSILAVLVLDAVAVLLLFRARKSGADAGASQAAAQKQRKPEARKRNEPEAKKQEARQGPAASVSQGKQTVETGEKPKLREQAQEEPEPSGEKAPGPRAASLNRLRDFESELRQNAGQPARSASSPREPERKTPGRQQKQRTEEKPKHEEKKTALDQAARDGKTQLDESSRGGKTVLDGSARGGGTVLDESPRGGGTVLDESSRGGKTVLDESPRGGGTVLDESSRGGKTVLDGSARRGGTVIDDSARRGGTVLDESPRGGKTVLDGSARGGGTVLDEPAYGGPGRRGEPGRAEEQWGVRRKSPPAEKDPHGRSTLPDVTSVRADEPKDKPKEIRHEKGTEGTLEYLDGDVKLRIFLTEGETRLGSQLSKVDYVLPSQHISRLHAIFTRRGDRYFVRDMHSTNGTFLNDSETPIPSDVDIEIKDGYRIKLAKMTFHFNAGDVTEGNK